MDPIEHEQMPRNIIIIIAGIYRESMISKLALKGENSFNVSISIQ
jgi:hypothetical protein